ncbi:hypothetical protein COSO111634_19325 [Corallococcus soli]
MKTAHSGASRRTVSTSALSDASPPTTSRFSGSTCFAFGPLSKALKCEGTTFKPSTRCVCMYAPSASASDATSLPTRCSVPPPHSIGKTAVCPRSAASVVTDAKLIPSVSFSRPWMLAT